tara:strand:+ start:3810 stop:4190 length:381 start_codon:yes stop_codon:yes gene_type:complete
MKTMLIMLALFAGPVAADTNFGVIIGSSHYSGTEINNPNESNLGVYVQRNNWQLGGYSNSYKETSLFVAREIPFTENLSASFGLVNGYNKSYASANGILPVFFFNFKYKPFVFSINPEVVVVSLIF